MMRHNFQAHNPNLDEAAGPTAPGGRSTTELSDPLLGAVAATLAGVLGGELRDEL